MGTVINLLTIPYLDINYENVIDFGDRETQYNWFRSKVERQIESNIKYDSIRTDITINLEESTCRRYDYLFYEDDNKMYFYFILTREVVTGKTTKLNVKLDVWNTYRYSMKLLDSFVERCHVQRWSDNGLPTINTEDEGLEYGENIMLTPEPIKICDLKPAIVISSSTPMGYVPMPSGGGGGGTGD